MSRPLRHRRTGSGFALMGFLALLVAGVLAFLVTALGPEAMEAYRARKTASTLAEAKEALIGFAVSYRDAHPGQMFGFLPCPDIDNDGIADTIGGVCGPKDVAVAGRLPWKTLGLSDLRDGSGECLWYVVSGHFKDAVKTDNMNWDTLGYINLKDGDNNTLVPAGEHDSPIAMIIAPGSPIGANASRSPSGTTVCSGSLNVSAYLEGLDINTAAEARGDPALLPPTSSVYSSVAQATATSINAGTDNDRVIYVRPSEIFGKVMKRPDFKNDVDTTLLSNLSGCVNLRRYTGVYSSLPNSLDDVFSDCGASVGTLANKVQSNWKDNLLYAKQDMTVNGVPHCEGVLAFSGSKEPAQYRRTQSEKATISNYLSVTNISGGSIATTVSGGSGFDSTNPTQDLFQCLKSTGALSVSFDQDMAMFATAGTAAGTQINDGGYQELVLGTLGGSSSKGCFWFSNSLPLWDSGTSTSRTWRLYFRSRFAEAESFPSSAKTEAERNNAYGDVNYRGAGYGFTFELLQTAPSGCGNASTMGTLLSQGGPPPVLRGTSAIFETDIFRNATGDPAGNHVAIFGGTSLTNLNHSTTPTTACDGSQAGCLFSPTYFFEEPDTPTERVQRIEIQPGYSDSTCTSAGTQFARLRTWVFSTGSCFSASCTNLMSNFPTPPNSQYCVDVQSGDWSKMYFGFTGGFTASQGVAIWDFNLRVE